MKVTLLAYTIINPDICGYNSHKGVPTVLARVMEWDYDAEPADTLAEFAGRSCYQSFDKPNAATRTNRGYLSNILSQSHFSVLEHASATFYLEGVSRNLTHELIRHRHLSFSELSQRFVDMEDYAPIMPPAMEPISDPADWFQDHQQKYQVAYDSLIDLGASRKQAREAARAFLPSSMETKMVVTGNMRAWRDVLQKRISPHADAEIQLLSQEILRQLKEIAPNTFQDFE